MTRILHILQTPRAEGTPNLVLDWLAAGSGHWQGVLALHARPADLTDQLRAAADAYREHALLDRGRWGKFAGITAACRRAAADWRADVAICWVTGFAAWALAGARAGGCRRLIAHAGNPADEHLRGRLLTRYVAWPLAALRAEVVCCSRYVEGTYRRAAGVPRSLFRTVYNCTRAGAVATRAAAARAADPKPRRPTAVMVATLEAHKDHDTLLDAVPLVLKAVPDFCLRLVGAGSRRDRVAARVAELGLGGTVEMLGSRPDVPELLGRSDLFAFSTTPQEGLGSVLLEALAAGLPVVATDVPACRELLAGGRWGALVPPKDPAALAAGVVAAYAAPPVAGGAAYAAGFSPGRMMDEYLRPDRRARRA